MAIYGIGAAFGGEKDVLPQFIKQSFACVGWTEKEAPPLHAMLRHFKVGDIVYIKSHPPNVGLIIRAVGIVMSDKTKPYTVLGVSRTGIPVKWLWKEEQQQLGQLNDKYPVRNITLYEEFNLKVQKRVLKLLLSKIE
jgi:hypothetical protein